jgi:hypothetical protein
VSFYPPGTPPRKVELKLRAKSSMSSAMREWMLRDQFKDLDAPQPFDVRQVTAFWTYGRVRKTRTPCSNIEHLFVDMPMAGLVTLMPAIAAYAASGRKGIYPPDLFAFLDQHSNLLLHKRVGKPAVLESNRLLYVGFDLARPLKEQFDLAYAQCQEIRDWTHAIAEARPPRPEKRETMRDVLVYTLRESAGLPLREIAKRVFPREDQTAAVYKVKKALRRVRRKIRAALSKSE